MRLGLTMPMARKRRPSCLYSVRSQEGTQEKSQATHFPEPQNTTSTTNLEVSPLASQLRRLCSGVKVNHLVPSDHKRSFFFATCFLILPCSFLTRHERILLLVIQVHSQRYQAMTPPNLRRKSRHLDVPARSYSINLLYHSIYMPSAVPTYS